jgi:hypothetical protein
MKAKLERTVILPPERVHPWAQEDTPRPVGVEYPWAEKSANIAAPEDGPEDRRAPVQDALD